MAAPYSMDLRKRVFEAWKASGDADDVAATFAVSRAWVHRLAQRRGNGLARAAAANQVSVAGLGRKGRPTQGVGDGAARRHIDGAPGAIAHYGGAQHAVGGTGSARLDA